MSEVMTEMLKVRTSRSLAQALEAEAQRQMLSRSALIRRTLATALGLLNQESSDDERRAARTATLAMAYASDQPPSKDATPLAAAKEARSC